MSANSTIKEPCGLAPETKPVDPAVLVSTDDGKHREHAVVTKVAQLWDNASIITYSFFGGTENQKDAVDKVAVEWSYYANLNFLREDDNDKEAMIRIDFKRGGRSWSAVGKGATSMPEGEMTMNLGWIEDSPDVSDNNRGTILHEWGHALGLMHQHQSPARGGGLTLKPEAVYKYYGEKQHWDRSLVKSQILDVYNADNVSNYSKLDTKSIMMYFMPADMNEEGIEVKVNNALTDMDKAYMIINYPRNIPSRQAGKEWTLKKALDIAGVPESDQEDMLGAKSHIPTLRKYFADWNQQARAKELGWPKKPVPKPVVSVPSTGVPLTVTPANDDLARILALLLGGSGYTQSTGKPIGQATPAPGAKGGVAGVGVEQGLWSGLVSVLTHPVFQQVVGGVVNQVLGQHGLNPTSLASPRGVQNGLWSPPFITPPFVSPLRGVPFHHGVGAYAAPEGIQQGLWSGFTSILQHPLAQTMIKGAVDAVFTQHSINPTTAADIQQGLFSDIGAILKSPVVHKALTSVVDTILTQHGLTPVTVAQYPEVQQGVFSGLVDFLKNPTFQSVVKTVINGALTQRGINPVAAPASSPDAVQHGLISILGSLVGSLFQARLVI